MGTYKFSRSFNQLYSMKEFKEKLKFIDAYNEAKTRTSSSNEEDILKNMKGYNFKKAQRILKEYRSIVPGSDKSVPDDTKKFISEYNDYVNGVYRERKDALENAKNAEAGNKFKDPATGTEYTASQLRKQGAKVRAERNTNRVVRVVLTVLAAALASAAIPALLGGIFGAAFAGSALVGTLSAVAGGVAAFGLHAKFTGKKQKERNQFLEFVESNQEKLQQLVEEANVESAQENMDEFEREFGGDINEVKEEIDQLYHAHTGEHIDEDEIDMTDSIFNEESEEESSDLKETAEVVEEEVEEEEEPTLEEPVLGEPVAEEDSEDILSTAEEAATEEEAVADEDLVFNEDENIAEDEDLLGEAIEDAKDALQDASQWNNNAKNVLEELKNLNMQANAGDEIEISESLRDDVAHCREMANSISAVSEILSRAAQDEYDNAELDALCQELRVQTGFLNVKIDKITTIYNSLENQNSNDSKEEKEESAKPEESDEEFEEEETVENPEAEPELVDDTDGEVEVEPTEPVKESTSKQYRPTSGTDKTKLSAVGVCLLIDLKEKTKRSLAEATTEEEKAQIIEAHKVAVEQIQTDYKRYAVHKHNVKESNEVVFFTELDQDQMGARATETTFGEDVQLTDADLVKQEYRSYTIRRLRSSLKNLPNADVELIDGEIKNYKKLVEKSDLFKDMDAIERGLDSIQNQIAEVARKKLGEKTAPQSAVDEEQAEM